MDANVALKCVGEWGRMQKAVCLIVGLAQVPIATQMVLMVFVARDAHPTCLSRLAVGNSSDVCDSKICDKPIPAESDWPTIANEWSLICSSSYLTGMSQSATMLGVLIGCILCGPLADTWGRRPTLVGCSALIAMTSLYGALVDGYRAFVAARFVCGIGLAGHGLASFSLAAEYAPCTMRTSISMMQSSLFAVGIAVLSLMATPEVTSGWRQLTTASGVLVALCAAAYCWTPESVRWLCASGQNDRAKIVLQRIANFNGTASMLPTDGSSSEDKLLSRESGIVAISSLSTHVSSNCIPSVSSSSSESSDLDITHKREEVGMRLKKHPKRSRGGKLSPRAAASSSSALRQFLTNRTATFMLMVLMFSWFAASFTYYGVTMAAGGLSDNAHMSVALNGLVEVPGYALVWLVEAHVGRKLLIIAPLCLVSAALPLTPMMPLAAPLVAKMAVSVAFALIWQHSAEIMPTGLRSAGLGACSMSARVGGVLAPVVAVMATSHQLPFSLTEFGVYTLCTVLAAMLYTILPETRAKRLPETVRDMVELNRSAV